MKPTELLAQRVTTLSTTAKSLLQRAQEIENNTLPIAFDAAVAAVEPQFADLTKHLKNKKNTCLPEAINSPYNELQNEFEKLNSEIGPLRLAFSQGNDIAGVKARLYTRIKQASEKQRQLESLKAQYPEAFAALEFIDRFLTIRLPSLFKKPSVFSIQEKTLFTQLKQSKNDALEQQRDSDTEPYLDALRDALQILVEDNLTDNETIKHFVSLDILTGMLSSIIALTTSYQDKLFQQNEDNEDVEFYIQEAIKTPEILKQLEKATRFAVDDSVRTLLEEFKTAMQQFQDNLELIFSTSTHTLSNKSTSDLYNQLYKPSVDNLSNNIKAEIDRLEQKKITADSKRANIYQARITNMQAMQTELGQLAINGGEPFTAEKQIHQKLNKIFNDYRTQKELDIHFKFSLYKKLFSIPTKTRKHLEDAIDTFDLEVSETANKRSFNFN